MAQHKQETASLSTDAAAASISNAIIAFWRKRRTCFLAALPDDLIIRVLAHCNLRCLCSARLASHSLSRCFEASARGRCHLLCSLYRLKDNYGKPGQPLLARLRALEIAAIDACQIHEQYLAKSRVLAKSLLKLIVSQIAWSRELFPPDCFVQRALFGQTISILNERRFERSSLGDDDARRPPHPSLSLFHGVLDECVLAALDAGYLSRLRLVISHDEVSEHIIESWNIRILWKSGPIGGLEPFPAGFELEDDGEEVTPCGGTIGETSTDRPTELPKLTAEYVCAAARTMNAKVLEEAAHKAAVRPTMPKHLWLSILLTFRGPVTPFTWKRRARVPPMLAGMGSSLAAEQL
mmetsp:Transcript_43607/g.114618  ORF Transcript_43607/g.114618 Transcript_43607/m.114618 type:complete len:351 (-) Transcript_43607:163-1215(-)